MLEKYKTAKKILENYKQEHLLNFYDELNNREKNFLLEQICNTNFEQILNLYEASKTDEIIPHNFIEPLPYNVKKQLSKVKIDFFKLIGKKAILNNKCAVVTLAGGQGSRLGFHGPKGCFELDIKPKKSLFEILCDNLKKIQKDYQVTIPWYIMTSIDNDSATKKFFEEKNFFGYPKNFVFFFKQDMLPLIDVSGKLILEEAYKIKEASNGNGNVFVSMKKNGIIENMKQQNIEWVFFSGIDNVILEVVDPLLLGLTIANNKLIASKTLLKKNVEDKDWIFARKNGMPSIMNCCHLTSSMKTAKNEKGNFLYREINLLAHLFHLSTFDKIVSTSLPYHRAFKKNTFINEEGMKQVPENPNTFKFETFIFDAFSLFNDIELLRVEPENEFAPIKDFFSVHNPEVAKELYEKKQKRMIFI